MLGLFLAFASSTANQRNEIASYISSKWESSVRSEVHESYIVDVPIRHTVPSPSGNFKAQFYWDTYFTNLGLLRSGRLDLAKSNCDSLLWWIDRLGYVPNSAFVGDDNRSQPPLLCAMVRDVFGYSRDIEWLRSAVPRLEREYAFWIQNRSFADGLCHFGNQATDDYLIKFYDGTLNSRLGLSPHASREDKIKISSNFLAEAESGADFTPVYSGHALEFADVKLNSILYVSESNMAYFHRILDRTEEKSKIWQRKANHRAEAIQNSLWDGESGLFRSRNMVTRDFASIACADSFYPLWAGAATSSQAKQVCSNLHLFEREYGLAQTEPYSGGSYQWAYPIGWPPSQWIAVSGLKHYGFSEEARRIAGEYCAAQVEMYAASGHLWEKYDVNTGRPANGEYAADPMLGWTAGVFLALKETLEEPAVDHPAR
jgi:alpha,alpha-trehalase